MQLNYTKKMKQPRNFIYKQFDLVLPKTNQNEFSSLLSKLFSFLKICSNFFIMFQSDFLNGFDCTH